MPFSWDNFPYTNFHELNLDWFIKKFNEIFEEWESLYSTLTQWKDDTDADIAAWKTDTLAALDSWENDLLDTLEAWKTATGQDIEDWETAFETEYAELKDEVEDIRDIASAAAQQAVDAADAAAADAASISASAAQISENANNIDALTKILKKYNSFDYLAESIDTPSRTSQGITYTWNDDVCQITGTASADTVNLLYNDAMHLPGGLIPGESYSFEFTKTGSGNARYRCLWKDSENNILQTDYFSESGNFTVPSNATGVNIAIFISSGSYMGSGTTLTTPSVRENNVKSNAELSTDLGTVSETVTEMETDLEFLQKVSEVSENIISKMLSYPSGSRTTSGITWTWNSESRSFTVSGTAGAGGVGYSFITSSTTISELGLKFGDLLFIDIETNNNNVVCQIIINHGNNSYTYHNFTKASIFSIPFDATNIGFRLYVVPNATISPAATVKKVSLSKIGDMTAEMTENVNGKLLALGNSFLAGSIWKDGAYSHLSDYHNTIYGRIADFLGINKSNTSLTMISSTGILSPASAGATNFKTELDSISIASYDAIITHFNSGDIRGYALGTVNSEADDGTLAGAIIHMINRVRTQDATCRFILLSVPPYSSDPATSGNNVFTGNWAQGYSIADLDTVMHQLAEKYHFTYIDWQDAMVSYVYMYYADYTSGDTGPRHAKYEKVYRSLGTYATLKLK